MTPEAQRIAIAEACGWKVHPTHESLGADSVEAVRRMSLLAWTNGVETRLENQLPDFLNDLNAMREAILSLPKHNEIPLDRNIDRYNDYLIDVCGSINEAFNATAAQRAEAFLRMMGLWVET